MSEIVFLIDLTQDVAASRPVAYFARREFGLPMTFIVTKAFRTRDASGLWFDELREMQGDLPADVIEVATVAQAVDALQGRAGMLLSCSESSLSAHAFNHAVFLAAPHALNRVTLQHGLECIGFNHNAAHDRTWRHYIGLGCDLAGSWFEVAALHSVRPDQSAKMMAVGPPFGLDTPPATLGGRRLRQKNPVLHGLVCENLHSVRFGAGSKVAFVDALQAFAHALEAEDGTVELRPHPGGRYLEKQPVPLPPNVRLNRLPLYKQALDRFAFGISSPSSVILDMVWAGIPTGVWTSDDPSQDIGAYRGLHTVSNEAEWLDFARAATRDPEPFLTLQARYLENLPFPRDIAGRYRALIATATGRVSRVAEPDVSVLAESRSEDAA